MLDMDTSDLEIDNADLESELLRVPTLFNKYFRLFSDVKITLIKANKQAAIIRKQKYLQYTGKLSKAELDQMGWEYDPTNGLKLTKAELGDFLDGDEYLSEVNMKVKMLGARLEQLHMILDTIKYRPNHLKTLLDLRKFETGA